MSEPMTSNRRVAYHEAGHAVAAWLLEMGVESVSVNATGDHRGTTTAAGYTKIGATPADPYRLAQAAYSLQLAAGSAAERDAFGDCNTTVADSDAIGIPPMIRTQVDVLIQQALREHKAAVEAVAALLMCPPVEAPGRVIISTIEAALPYRPWKDGQACDLVRKVDRLIPGHGG